MRRILENFIITIIANVLLFLFFCVCTFALAHFFQFFLFCCPSPRFHYMQLFFFCCSLFCQNDFLCA